VESMTKILSALGAVGLMASAPAMAGTSDGSMIVSATVLDNCTIIAQPMSFGALTDVGSANVDTTATLALECTPNADFFVSMNNGANADGSVRRMKNAAGDEFLPYEVYSDAARAQRWGVTEGTDTVAGTASVLGTATLTAYGRIASGTSSPSAGVYTDTVTVTVNF